MNGTGTHDDQQPITILPMENSANRFPGFDDQGSCLIGNGQFCLDGTGGGECLDFDNVLVVDRSIHEFHAPRVGPWSTLA